MRTTLLLFALLFTVSLSTQAQVLGGEINYQLKDKQSLDVFLNIYAADPNNYYVQRNITITSVGSGKSITVKPSVDKTDDVTPVCANACTGNTCTVPHSIYEYRLSASVDLKEPFSETDCQFIISYQSFTRFARWSPFYLEAHFNRCQAEKNNAPVFKRQPSYFIPASEIYSYSFSAEDADGDSLYYSMVPSKTSASSQKNYKNGATYDAPFTYLGYPNQSGSYPRGFNFNENTGLLQFVATKYQTEHIAIKVSEYRNNQLIGEKVRDIVHQTIKANNSSPFITGVNGTNQERITACAGQETCFSVKVSDKDKTDKLKVEYTHNLLNAKINETQQNGVITIEVCWTPSKTQLNKAPFIFTIYAEDNGCDLQLAFDREIQINLAETIEAAANYKVIGCKQIKLTGRAQQANHRNYEYLWQIGDTQIAGKSIEQHFDLEGEHPYTLTVTDNTSGCATHFQSKVIVPKGPQATAGQDLVVCPKATITLTASGGEHYQWLNLPDNQQGNQKSITTTATSDQVYRVEVTDKHGCKDVADVGVSVHQTQFDLQVIDPVVCQGTQARLSFKGGTAYSWNGEIIEEQSPSTPYITEVPVMEKTDVKVKAVDDNGCETEQVLEIEIDEDCVWPGDANRDGLVNHHDLLPIGLAYNTQGPAPQERRDGFAWVPMRAPDWPMTFEQGLNYKHADANNDGMVNRNDLGAFDVHYNTTVPEVFTASGKNDYGALLQLSYSQDAVEAGDTVEITISLGTEKQPIKNVHGVAFSVEYDEYIKDNTVSFSSADSWLKQNGNTIELAKAIRKNTTGSSSTKSRIDLAISRTDKKGVSGWGILGKLRFVVDDNIDLKDDPILVLSIAGAMTVDDEGNQIPTYEENLSLPIHAAAFSNNMGRAGIQTLAVYPNPNSGAFNIVIPEGLTAENLQIRDASGRLITTAAISNSTNGLIRIEGLASGYYLVQMRSDQQQYLSKIVVQ